jgi:hypothetical protein
MAIPFLGLVGVCLLLTLTTIVARGEYPLPLDLTPSAYASSSFMTKESLSVPASTPWEYERECEYPDEHTVGMMIYRSNASSQKVHGQFGCEDTSGYPATSGYVKYVGINVPGAYNLFLILRYSKYSSSSVPIEISVDDELRASFYPENQWNWNVFTSTNAIPLGSVDSGVHSITFYTEGQQYGVADLDKFILTGYPAPQAFFPLVLNNDTPTPTFDRPTPLPTAPLPTATPRPRRTATSPRPTP